ncbi:hypothetical protein AgCh_035977 [Apium graveolens]
MTLEIELKIKQYKTVEDEEMIKLLGRYLKNAEANLPKTQINTNGDLDDDEQKKDDQKPSGSNPSQSAKATGSKNLMDTISTTEIKRVISLLKDKDTSTMAWRSVLGVWFIVREEKRAKETAEREEKDIKYAEEIEMFEQRSEELKAKGMSRIFKDGHFLNIKVGRFSRVRVDYLNSYSLDY